MKLKTNTEEKGKKLIVLKSTNISTYIILLSLMICGIWMLYRFDLVKYSYYYVLVIIVLCVLFSFPRIKIYEKCIIINKEIIKYSNIKSIEYIKKWEDVVSAIGRYRKIPSKITCLDIFLKDGKEKKRIIASNYSLKSLKLLTSYIGEYSCCDVRKEIAFLEEAKIKRKKDMCIAIIIVIILLITLYFAIKFDFIELL